MIQALIEGVVTIGLDNTDNTIIGFYIMERAFGWSGSPFSQVLSTFLSLMRIPRRLYPNLASHVGKHFSCVYIWVGTGSDIILIISI